MNTENNAVGGASLNVNTKLDVEGGLGSWVSNLFSKGGTLAQKLQSLFPKLQTQNQIGIDNNLMSMIWKIALGFMVLWFLSRILNQNKRY